MNFLTARNFAFLILFFLSFVCLASAQDKDQTTADENFTLKITEERITEANFERSTAVEVSDAEKNLSVGVGVAVRAPSINIILRGITGNVRFRASLEKISRLIERGKP